MHIIVVSSPSQLLKSAKKGRKKEEKEKLPEVAKLDFAVLKVGRAYVLKEGFAFAQLCGVREDSGGHTCKTEIFRKCFAGLSEPGKTGILRRKENFLETKGEWG